MVDVMPSAVLSTEDMSAAVEQVGQLGHHRLQGCLWWVDHVGIGCFDLFGLGLY